jgi:hypothetical protein
MPSRISIDPVTKGTQFAAPTDNVSATIQKNVYCNTVGAVNSGLQALQGASIRGLVVGPLEKWADNSVWDTTNSRYLHAGSDFDPCILNRA